jgi:hypothetical protein
MGPQLQQVPALLMDLFISFKSRVDHFPYEGPMLDIIAKESVLDSSAYQEVKLYTNLITSLGSDMLLTC